MVRKKNKMFVDSADRTPHYSLRKLSVGVASVLLSTTLWMGANGSVAHADTINNTTVAGKVEDKLDPSETHKDQTQAQNGQGQDAASVVTGANQTKNKEGSSANAEAQTATANDAQADVAKQEPAAQSQQTAPQAQVPASAESQASTAEQAAGQASAAATEGQTNGSANAGAAIDATTKAKKDSANPEANSSDAATEGAKNESTTLDVSQAFKTSTAATVTKKMVMSSLADSISENKPTDTTAVPGFSVTDPEYPSEMYRDPDSEHYSFFWADLTDPDNYYHYQTVISTNRNGDGQIHVFELDQSNNVLDSFDLDKNKSYTSGQTGATYFNDEYAGLIRAGSNYWTQGELTLKYEVSGGKTDQPYNKLSFIVPRLNTQVTSYKDENGKDITEPVVQRGLDGQKYTTTDTKVIDGYYAIAPSNAQGTMSPYGKINSTYEKNWHDGYSAVFTQTDNDGTMSVQMYYKGRAVKKPIIIKPGDHDIYSGVGSIYLRSIYVPQTTDIRYVYKKLGTTFFVGEDKKPFMGNTPKQYPNDYNDPTKAGRVDNIPQYEGYTPTINGVPVGPDGFIPTDPGKDTYVVYKADTQKATVTYIDDTDNKTTLKSDSLEGDSNSVASTKDGSPYTTESSINSYKSQGYELVSDSTDGKQLTFDSDSSVDQHFVVHLKHGTSTKQISDDVNRTINYTMSDGSKAPAQVKDSIHFSGTQTIDKVTKKVTNTTWDPNKDFKDVTSPAVKGYTPNRKVVSDKNIAHDHADIVENVVYTPEIQKLDVTYHDDTTNTDLKKDEISGDSNSVASKDGTPYTTGSSIDDYKNKGYELVSDSTDGKQLTFDSDSSVDQHFVVHLKHGTVTVTPDDKNPVEPGDKINPNDPDPNSPKYQDDVKHDNLAKDAKQTIHYEGAGTDTPADNVTTQKDAFTRTVTYDKVTGKSTTSKWSKTKTTFDKVDNPVVKGYTTKNKQAGGLTATPEDPEVTDTVVYTPNGSIVPVDPNGNPIPNTPSVPYETDPTDPTKVVDGKVPEVPGWTPKNGKPGDPVVPTDPSKDTKVPYEGDTKVEGKQTVTYVYKDKNGKVVKTKTVEQDTTFTGKTTTDEVTGETTTVWDQKDNKYTEVTTPVEPGYIADKKSVGGETVTPADPNRSYTVVYTPNGSIVPVDPNGNPIPGTKPVPYETDPKDPTKVVNGKVPEVPGWTPKNGKPGDPVVPTDPTKDTKVPYVHTKVVDDKVPEVPSWTPKNDKPVKPSDPTKDTEVPDDHTMTPGETTATGKVEGLPEKPAKSAKAPAEKLVKTPVKAPKAVKEAAPAEMPAQKAAQAQDQLPQTGEDNSKAAFGLGLASILGGIGILGAFKRKKKEN